MSKDKVDKSEKQESLEDNFKEIEAILSQMENQEVTLDESFSLYKNGVERLKKCNTLLDEVEKKMQIMNEDGTLGDF